MMSLVLELPLMVLLCSNMATEAAAQNFLVDLPRLLREPITEILHEKGHHMIENEGAVMTGTMSATAIYESMLTGAGEIGTATRSTKTAMDMTTTNIVE
jgi:hypothetical protein